MSVVKINAITVPRDRFEDFADRFASRAGKVEQAEGFEAFELLRPNDERDVCLVLTRWRSEEDFQAWLTSADFAAGHSQHRDRGPVGTDSEIWSFDVLELKEAVPSTGRPG
jgi:heme oxygenase (mycobilin-producing)